MTISLQIGKTYETATGSRFKCVELYDGDIFFAKGELIYAHPQCPAWRKEEIGDIYNFTEKGYFQIGKANLKPGFDLVREHDLIEMLPEERAPTDRVATMTLRVNLDQVSDVCNIPGVTIVNLMYDGEE